MGLLKLINLRKLLPYVLIVLFAVMTYYSGYIKGRGDEAVKIIQEQAESFEETTEQIHQGRREFREANPDGDAAVSLERLRNRQARD